MKKQLLRSRLEEMIDSLDEIISGVSEQTRELEKLLKFRKELRELKGKVDDGWKIDWKQVAALMKEFVAFIYSFSAE